MLNLLKRVNFLSVIGLAVCAGLICSCSGFSVTGGPGKTVAPRLMVDVPQPSVLRTINSLVVMPIEFASEVGAVEATRSVAERELHRALQEEIDLELANPTKVNAAVSKYAQTPFPERTKRIANEFNADGVLVTRILKFNDREGSSVGATEQAELDLLVSILDPVSAREVWRASYVYRDEALSDNLFKIGDRINNQGTHGWVRGSELLRLGFKTAMHDLALKRMAQFDKNYVPEAQVKPGSVRPRGQSPY